MCDEKLHYVKCAKSPCILHHRSQIFLYHNVLTNYWTVLHWLLDSYSIAFANIPWLSTLHWTLKRTMNAFESAIFNIATILFEIIAFTLQLLKPEFQNFVNTKGLDPLSHCDFVYSNAMWLHRSGSTLAQVMACCLMVASHYMNNIDLSSKCSAAFTCEQFPKCSWIF